MGSWKRLLTTDDLSDVQIIQLQNLVFVSGSATLSDSPNSFEKGVSTDVTFTYSATANDSVFVSAEYGPSNNLVDVTSDGLSGGTELVENNTNSVSRQYKVIFSHNGVEGSAITKNQTFLAIKPQFFGVSTEETFNNASYSTLTSELTKVVQTSGQIPSSTGQELFSPTDQFVFFISNTSGLVVKDSNGFPQTDFTETEISIKLANGTTQTGMFQYRTNTIKTLTNFGYELG